MNCNKIVVLFFLLYISSSIANSSRHLFENSRIDSIITIGLNYNDSKYYIKFGNKEFVRVVCRLCALTCHVGHNVGKADQAQSRE